MGCLLMNLQPVHVSCPILKPIKISLVVGDKLSVKWPSRLSLGVKSPDKSDNISYLRPVLFYFVNVVISKTRYFENFPVV